MKSASWDVLAMYLTMKFMLWDPFKALGEGRGANNVFTRALFFIKFTVERFFFLFLKEDPLNYINFRSYKAWIHFWNFLSPFDR